MITMLMNYVEQKIGDVYIIVDGGGGTVVYLVPQKSEKMDKTAELKI